MSPKGRHWPDPAGSVVAAGLAGRQDEPGRQRKPDNCGRHGGPPTARRGARHGEPGPERQPPVGTDPGQRAPRCWPLAARRRSSRSRGVLHHRWSGGAPAPFRGRSPARATARASTGPAARAVPTGRRPCSGAGPVVDPRVGQPPSARSRGASALTGPGTAAGRVPGLGPSTTRTHPVGSLRPTPASTGRPEGGRPAGARGPLCGDARNHQALAAGRSRTTSPRHDARPDPTRLVPPNVVPRTASGHPETWDPAYRRVGGDPAGPGPLQGADPAAQPVEPGPRVSPARGDRRPAARHRLRPVVPAAGRPGHLAARARHRRPRLRARPAASARAGVLRRRLRRQARGGTSTRLASSLGEETGGDLARSPRWDEVLRPVGIGDIAAVACRDASGCWGWIEAYRDASERPFSDDDLDLLAAAGPSMAWCCGGRSSTYAGKDRTRRILRVCWCWTAICVRSAAPRRPAGGSRRCRWQTCSRCGGCCRPSSTRRPRLRAAVTLRTRTRPPWRRRPLDQDRGGTAGR